jgi:hypothetical protein
MGLCKPEEDFGIMMAYNQTVATMRTWENQRQADEMERQRNEQRRNTEAKTRKAR